MGTDKEDSASPSVGGGGELIVGDVEDSASRLVDTRGRFFGSGRNGGEGLMIGEEEHSASLFVEDSLLFLVGALDFGTLTLRVVIGRDCAGDGGWPAASSARDR